MPVQILMRFLETKPVTAAEPVWPKLDPVDRDEIVRVLARLIAKAVVQDGAEAGKEVGDE